MQLPKQELPPFSKRNHALTRFILQRLERSLEMKLRLHGFTGQFDANGGIVVANHFTRLETFVLPFVIYREFNVLMRILAAPVLFGNAAFGDYLRSMGALPTDYPDKYELISRDILHGGWWLIFPEGGLIKDRKVLDRGKLNVATDSGLERRRPRSGAAVLAMMVQQYKAALRQDSPVNTARKDLGFADMPATDIEAIANSPTPIVPLNVTYYPLHPQENALKSIATYLMPNMVNSGFGQHLLEELTVEGSMLFKGVEVDMRLGEPLLIVDADIKQQDGGYPAPRSSSPWRRYLNTLQTWVPTPSYSYLLDNWTALHSWRQQRRAWQITRTAMQSLYQLTTVNMDHILSVLLLQSLRTTQQRHFAVRDLKRQLYLAIHTLQDATDLALHPTLIDPDLNYCLLTDTPHAAMEGFAQRSMEHGLITCDDETWNLNADILLEPFSYGTLRLKNFIQVYYNEAEPLDELMQVIRYTMSKELAEHETFFSTAMFTYEQQLYETDYRTFATPGNNDKIRPLAENQGAPILLPGAGDRCRMGVLLIHGYSASPGEVLPLAQSINQEGFTVYVVRMRGHGTSPYDLQQRDWEDWYASVERGYAALRTLSDIQYAGGMSTGGSLALYLASQHLGALQGVFAVGAPVKLQNRAVHLAPIVKTVRGFINLNPANAVTNYTVHPVQALHELTRFISTYDKTLDQIDVPALLIQARGDTTVRPESAQHIYDRLTCTDKTLLWKEINQHVIVGDGFPEVHRDIVTFLQQHSPVELTP